MFRTYCPRQLWIYGYLYIANIMIFKVIHAGILQRQTSPELMAEETPDISEYLDFGWYDRVWFKEVAGLRETHIVRYLGPFQNVGSLMSYWILRESSIPVSRTTVQRVTYIETCTNASKQRFESYDKAIKEIFHKKYPEKGLFRPQQDQSDYGDVGRTIR